MSLLGISLAVHIIVFFVIRYFTVNNSDISIIPPYQPSSFSVVFENTSISVRNVDTSKKIPTPLPIKKLASEKNNKTVISDKITTEIKLRNKSLDKSKKYKALLIRQVKSEISHYFNYPTFARRKGWHGIVLLEFNVTHAGIISNIEIKNSSGYEILDRAAHKSLSHVQRINISLYNNLPLNTRLQVPILYQLTEG